MTRLLSTAGLARASARRPLVVLAGWIVALAAAGAATAVGLGDVLTTDIEFLGRPESVRADELLHSRFRMEGGADATTETTETVLIQSATLPIDDPAFRERVEQTAAALLAAPDLVAAAPTHFDAMAAGDPRAALMVSEDRRTTLIPVTLAPRFDEDADTERYADLVAAQGGDGFTVVTVGESTVDALFTATSESDLQKEILGLPVTLIVLVLVFGALVAAGIPIVLALFAIGVSLGLTALIGQVWQLSLYVVNMITVIGLAVGIDYALFVVERYREERRLGREKPDAIEVAGGTASKAVLFSGLTVVLALTGMFLIPTTIFRSLGLGAILVTAVAVIATLTLVPALLSLLGDKIDWPRHRAISRQHSTFSTQDFGLESQHSSGMWARLARAVMARPLLSAGVSAGLLLLCALPYVDLETGTASVATLPEGDVRTGFAILQEEFYAGVLAPVEIVVDTPRSPQADAALDGFVASLATDPAFGPMLERTWNEAEDLAYLAFPLAADANSPEAYATVERLRGDLIPAAFPEFGGEVLVTGDAAENLDFNQVVATWTPRVVAFVLGLSFVLLLIAFRSLIVPVKAIVMNLLSVGAAYGLMVLVFQKGYGADFFGFQQTPTIEAWVPIFLFCVLFGLSMDYHVFLLSRIREHYDQTGRNAEAVAVGLQRTAKIITGAALIMVVVFAAFAAGDLVMFQQMGFGLAVAILLDATIVRSVLVPATMALLGDRNWYLPSWLQWLPDVRIEGAPAQPDGR